VYTYLHHGKTIWRQWKSSTTEKPDIHMKLMRRYKEAPTWWYLSLFVVVCENFLPPLRIITDTVRCLPLAFLLSLLGPLT
jgi:OPT oligopeptide transporter protein.